MLKEKFTPMMKQYLTLKEKHKDKILLFRLGDFYETFFEDAEITSRVLGIVLTSREAGKGRRVPMAGIPYHALESYLGKLIREGYKVAICEQMEDPKLAKGLVKREVVRIITPGTILEENLLKESSPNYLLSLFPSSKRWGMAWVDISTGDFWAWEAEEEKGKELVEKLSPSEILLPESVPSPSYLDNLSSLTPYPDWSFSPQVAKETLCNHFKVHSIDGLGIREFPLAMGAAGGLLSYLKDVEGRVPDNIQNLRLYSSEEYLMLDSDTIRNLELIKTYRGEEGEGTLLSILDNTLTAMGARLLRYWLLHPLRKVKEIESRLDAVEEMVKSLPSLKKLRENLKGLSDLERIISRLDAGLARARELIGLKNTLKKIPHLKETLSTFSSSLLKELFQQLDEVKEVSSLIEEAIVESPPLSLKEGGLIKEGYSPELDELKKISQGGKEWIADLQRREIQRTGIKSLKVGYNKVFGYYIEVTKPNLHLVPSDYIRKQTLTNAERFITPELKEKESLILGAEERIKEMEYEIFLQVRERILKYLPQIQRTARALATIDTLASLAMVALKNNYTRPQVDTGESILIQEGRHPVLERILSEPFIPNDTEISPTSRILIITGPNMAGKSTYIRQVALIVLLAQMGSFVPAKEAKIGVVDRIFTRVGATDELTRARSTFMVEMNEVANILRNATSESLIILDEVGRGTSTFDGISIAWAVAEFIHENIHARTLFATHYHEITELERDLPQVKNYHIEVKEWGGKVVFLRKIKPGSTDRSYGIQVARLAGLPHNLIQRAQEILKNLERKHEGITKKRVKDEEQLTFFSPRPHPILEELKKLDILKITPLQAFEILKEITQRLKEEA